MPRSEPTAAEIVAYREQGFVAIPGFLDADELAEWRSAVDEAVTERDTMLPHQRDPVAAMRDHANEAVREAWAYYDRVFTQRVNLWQTNERVKKLVLDPALGRLATLLAGVEGIRLWHDQALIKEPWGNPTAFHPDVTKWSFDSPHALSIWVALDDATLQNGCMGYIPGSHKTPRFDDAPIGKALGACFEVYPEFAHIEPVFVPLKAGDAAFHNGLTLHGAGANLSLGRRRAMTVQFMPDGATYNGKPNILRPDQLAKLSVGDRLEDPEQNPLIYSLTAEARA